MKTLSQIKSDLLTISSKTNCKTVILKDCYLDSGTMYSLMLKSDENKTFKVDAAGTEQEISIN